MKKEKIDQLIRVYNTLLTLNVSGDNIFILSNCLTAFKDILIELRQEQEEKDIKE